jgi:hypothetical protein
VHSDPFARNPILIDSIFIDARLKHSLACQSIEGGVKRSRSNACCLHDRVAVHPIRRLLCEVIEYSSRRCRKAHTRTIYYVE